MGERQREENSHDSSGWENLSSPCAYAHHHNSFFGCLVVEPEESGGDGCTLIMLSSLGQEGIGLLSADLLGEVGYFWTALMQLLDILKEIGPEPVNVSSLE